MRITLNVAGSLTKTFMPNVFFSSRLHLIKSKVQYCLVKGILFIGTIACCLDYWITFCSETVANDRGKEINSSNDTNNWGTPTGKKRTCISISAWKCRKFYYWICDDRSPETWTENIEPILFELKTICSQWFFKLTLKVDLIFWRIFKYYF